MKRGNISLSKLILFSVALLTLLISGTTVYSLEQFKRLRDITLVVLFVLLLMNALVNLNAGKLKKRLAIVTIGALVFFAGSFISFPSESIHFFSKVLMFVLFSYLLYDEKNAKFIFKYLYDLIVVISVVALVFFVTLYVLKIPLPYTLLNNGFYRSYMYLFYNADIYKESFGSFAYYRLQGVFWEPGVYGIYLILALFYYAFIDEEKDKRKLYIIVICLLLTSSTTGTALGLVVFGVLLLSKIKKQNERLLVLIPISLLACLVGYYLLIAKKYGGGGYSASYNLRMVDLTNSFDIWRNHFFWGTGYNNVAEFEAATRLYQRHNSNGFMNWCMTMGLWGLIAQVLPLVVNIIKTKNRGRIIHIAFAIIYVGINMTEPLITSPLMIMLIAFEYVMMVNKYGGNELNGFKR